MTFILHVGKLRSQTVFSVLQTVTEQELKLRQQKPSQDKYVFY